MAHHKEEKTLVVIKPDGVQRSLIGEIITRYERVGLKLIAMRFFTPDSDHVEKHYTLEPTWKKSVGEKAIKSYEKRGLKAPSNDPIEVGERVLQGLKKYLTAGPVVAMVWQGAHAVDLVRKLTGGTEPLSSDVGTIRGDYVLDSYQMSDSDGRAVRNLVHASGSVNEAENEINLWFEEKDVIDYTIAQEKILYDINFDGKEE